MTQENETATKPDEKSYPFKFLGYILIFGFPVANWLSISWLIGLCLVERMSLWGAIPIALFFGAIVFSSLVYAQGGRPSILELNIISIPGLILIWMLIPVFVKVHDKSMRHHRVGHYRPASVSGAIRP